MTDTKRIGHSGRTFSLLLALFVLALLPRLYSAVALGWDWDAPDSFTLVNFDESGSCRAALDGFEYTGFVGRQTIAIAELTGNGPQPGIRGNPPRVKAYCHGAEHMRVARVYSAFAGALTVPVLVLVGLLLVPSQTGVGWTAGGLLALSGFHISESQVGTADAPSTFFIYLFLLALIYSHRRGTRGGFLLSPLLLIPAVWTKYWVFAFFAYVSVLPMRLYQYLAEGMSSWRLALVILATAVLFGALGNSDFRAAGLYPLLALYYLFIPWRRLRRPLIAFWLLVPLLAYLLCQLDVITVYTMGGLEGRFGTSYGAIGWNKWLRNMVNVPVLLVVALGFPAFVFSIVGLRRLFSGVDNPRAWLCLTPLLLFALYMAFVAPVTYYRHYLPLVPAAALLAAYGLYATAWAARRWFMVLFFLWPALLALDMVQDYHRDPRIELRQWYQENPRARVFITYYVSPPANTSGNSRPFRPEYAFGDGQILRQADFLILSENWYDTAFANELNGPLVGNATRLVKTRPEYAAFYRSALAGTHPYLSLEKVIEVGNFMPELALHRYFYGTFQLFVGDLRIYRVIR